MKFFSVIVRPDSSSRYTDSNWVSEEAAKSRVEQLRTEFKRRGFTLAPEGEARVWWGAWYVDCELQDARIVSSEDPK